jgi:tetratricopeptide (TPR) repeat protein
LALRFAGALGWFWATFHNTEGMRRIEQILGEAPTTPSLALGRALQAAAYVDSYMPTADTQQRALASVAILDRFGDRRGAARSRLIAAFIEMMRAGDIDSAAALVDSADEAARAVGDSWTRALASLTRFRFLLHRGDLASALQHGADALARFTALDDPWGMPWTSVWLAVAQRTAGELGDARRLLEDTIPTVPGSSYLASLALQELGNILALQGEHDAAANRHRQALDLAARSAVRILTAFAHNAAGFGARARGDPTNAKQHYREALRLFHDLGHDDGVRYSRCGLGLAELDLGHREAANRELRDAAKSALRTGRPEVLAAALDGLALLRSATQPLDAARLLGAAGRLRDDHGLRCGALELDEAAGAAAAARAQIVGDAFCAACAAGAKLAPEQLLEV